ncbi:hypothetical protein JD844_019399 [Phrynosoma platyrhinos]|uniref:WAP domain-containing protein n=1 Tax=Phrynosoma platyrhinos TaxID=52577 RepID=A0ABQ7SPZ2_PHRPL|nr:hypothetical protein JD844_019399 [Phrynosoma platyrhinos]
MKPRSTKPSHNSIYQLLFLSLLGLSTFCAQVDASEYNVTVAPGKPGTCPANTETVTTGRNCTTECRSDTDCGGNKKCCPEGCGMSCRTPDGNAYASPYLLQVPLGKGAGLGLGD